MTGRIPNHAQLGDSPDNASRDADRQARETRLELDRQLRAGEISRADYDAMLSVIP